MQGKASASWTSDRTNHLLSQLLSDVITWYTLAKLEASLNDKVFLEYDFHSPS
jgi:hypothetical protein